MAIFNRYVKLPEGSGSDSIHDRHTFPGDPPMSPRCVQWPGWGASKGDGCCIKHPHGVVYDMALLTSVQLGDYPLVI